MGCPMSKPNFEEVYKGEYELSADGNAKVTIMTADLPRVAESKLSVQIPERTAKSKKERMKERIARRSEAKVSPEKIEQPPAPEVAKEKCFIQVDAKVFAKYAVKGVISSREKKLSATLRVEHRHTKQPYAMKTVNKLLDERLGWQAELAVLRRVRHSHIVQLVEVFDTLDTVYIVMELATGGDLHDRLCERGEFPESDAQIVVKQLLEALRYLHGICVVHRDLKLENILFYHPGRDSKILLSDFGLSATSQGETLLEVCGTPEYVAAEVLARRAYGTQVDMWAVGVITYILISLEMPFEDESRPRLFRKILRSQYTYNPEGVWPDITSGAKNFIDRLLMTEPHIRMTANQALRHSWISQRPFSARSIVSASTLRTISSAGSRARSPSLSSVGSRSHSSLKSSRRAVQLDELEELHADPTLLVELAILSNGHKSS